MATADTLRQNIERRGQVIFDRAVQLTKDALRDAAPVGETGDTRKQVDVRPVAKGTKLVAEAVAPAKGGEFVEKGTKRHVIPKGGRGPKVLRFDGNDGVTFRRVVVHPGTRAKPWFKPTVAKWQRILAQAARETR